MTPFSDSRIHVSLASEVDHSWQTAHTLNHEILMNARMGRCLRPGLIYSINGLRAENMYSMSLRMELVDDVQLKNANGERVEVISDVGESSKRQVWHKYGEQLGCHWMAGNVNFKQVYISRHKSDRFSFSSIIYLHPSRRYIPVLCVYEKGKLVHEGKVPHTMFTAVTRYTNPAIASFKKGVSPFASRKKINLTRKIDEGPSENVATKKKKEESTNSQASTSSLSRSVPEATKTPSTTTEAFNTNQHLYAVPKRSHLIPKNKDGPTGADASKKAADKDQPNVIRPLKLHSLTPPANSTAVNRTLPLPYLGTLNYSAVPAVRLAPLLPRFTPVMVYPMMLPLFPTPILLPNSFQSMTPYTASTGTPITISGPEVEEDDLEIEIIGP